MPGARELIAAFARRELSPVEVTEDCLRRVESQGTRAFTTLTAEAALAAARDAEARYGRDEARPLEGVPTAVKDLFDTAGVRTTYGSPIFAEHVPGEDAAAVRRLKDAGAVILGKTTTHEFAWGLSGINPHYGTPVNPRRPDRVPGGSSCGSAAALAAGEVALALGTDTGGSIRVPASFCGVVGLKPTHGEVPLDGCFALAPSLDHAGPMARTVDDLVLMFEVLAGRRIALAEGEEVPEPGETLPDVTEVFKPIQLVEALGTHQRAGLWPDRRDEYGADVGARLELAGSVTLGEYMEAAGERERLRATLGPELHVTPISSGPPPLLEEHEATRELVVRHTTPQNLFGLPACAVGELQVSGPPGSEARVLAAARELERRLL